MPRGERLPPPLFPGFDSLGALRHITSTGYDYSWLVLDRRTLSTEFALSGSEQNPDLTGKDLRQVIGRARGGPTGPVQAFLDHGADFVVRPTVAELAKGMNELTGTDLIEANALRRLIMARDQQVASGLGKDPQVVATAAARRYVGDRLTRIVRPHRFLDGSGDSLVAVRCHVLTRKTLGGLETDLSARVLRFGRSAPFRGFRCRRGGRIRRRRRTWLPRAGGHVPRRLPVLRSNCWPRGRCCRHVTRWPAGTTIGMHDPWPQRRMMHTFRGRVAPEASADDPPMPRRRRARTVTGGTVTPTTTTPSMARSSAWPISCGAPRDCARPMRICSARWPTAGFSRSAPARRCARGG